MSAHKKGFTIIEIIIVILIIAILATVAAPMMRTIKTRAIVSEAVNGLALLRTALRAYKAEHDSYPPGGNYYGSGFGSLLDSIAIKKRDGGPGALDGAYWSEKCYQVIIGSSIDIYAENISDNDAPNNVDTKNIGPIGSNTYIRMYSDGRIRSKNISDSGYQSE